MSQVVSPFFNEDSSETQKKQLTPFQRRSNRLKKEKEQKIKTEIREKKMVHRRLEAITNKLLKIQELIDANENEHDLFGKQVAASLKFLPHELSIQLQDKIQTVINEFNQTHEISVPTNMMSCTQNENQEEEVEMPSEASNEQNALETMQLTTAPLLLPSNTQQPLLVPSNTQQTLLVRLNTQQPHLVPLNTKIQHLFPLNAQQSLQLLSTKSAQPQKQQYVINQGKQPLVLAIRPMNNVVLKPLEKTQSTVNKSLFQEDEDDDSTEEIEIKEEVDGVVDDYNDPLGA